MKYKSIFISDIHLGTSNSLIIPLLNFLKNNEFERIYLIGDIIDLMAIKRKIKWSNNENLFIQKLLRLSRKGIIIYYIPGNHDSSIHTFNKENIGNISIQSKMVINIGKDKALLVHGDEFDGALKSMVFLYSFGEVIYDYLILLNPIYLKFRKLIGIHSDFSLSYYLKNRVKNIMEYLSQYEILMVKKAKMYDCNIVICGHSHFPESKTIEGIRYFNCGCWTFDSTGSLIVEHLDNRLELIEGIK